VTLEAKLFYLLVGFILGVLLMSRRTRRVVALELSDRTLREEIGQRVGRRVS
jgi:hypothetical protein